MSGRSHLRFVVRSSSGLVVQNARANLYVKGTSTPRSDAWNAEVGGSLVTFVTSNNQGEVEAWLDAPGDLDIEVTTNSGAAFFTSTRTPASFPTFRETVTIGVVAADLTVDGAANVPSLRTLGFTTIQAFPGDAGVLPNTIFVRSTGNDTKPGNVPGQPVATVAQAVTLAGSSPTNIVVQDSVTVPANVTIPSTIALTFTRRGAIKPSSGVTVTIEGSVWAGRWKIFDRVSGGTVTFASTASVSEAYPEWWGALGDGATADWSPINAALTASAICDATLIGRTSAVYAVTAAITLPANSRFDLGQSTIKQNVATASPVINLASGARLYNGTIDCNSLVTGTVIHGTGITDVQITSLKITDPAHASFSIQIIGASADILIDNNVIDGARTGVRISGSSRRVKVTNNRIRGTKDGGIYVVTNGVGGPSPSEVEISGNLVSELDSTGTARTYIQVTGDPNAHCQNILISRNWCLGIGKSYTDPTTPGTADQITFNYTTGINVIGNVSMFGGDCGISGTLNNNVNIVGNYCAYNDSVGIIVGSASGATNGATVTGNTSVNNAQSRMNDRPDWAATGVTFWLGVGAVVAGNTLADSQATTPVTVTNKALTANVATLTTATAHKLAVDRRVIVAGVDATFDGTYTVTATPTTTTFSYTKVAADVASQAATGTAAFATTQRYGLCYKFSTDLRLGQNAYKGNLLGRILNDGGNTNCGPIFDDGIQVNVGGSVLTKLYYASPVLDWPSIPAQSTSELTTTVTGAAVGDRVIAHPNSTLEAGLIMGTAYVSAVDTVAIRLANVTAAAIDPANRTWRVTVMG